MTSARQQAAWRRSAGVVTTLAVLAALVCAVTPASAHPFEAASWTLTEHDDTGDTRIVSTFERPARAAPGEFLRPHLPADCRLSSGDPNGHATYRCDATLSEREVAVDGFAESPRNVVGRYERRASDQGVTFVLRTDRPRHQLVLDAATWWRMAELGVHHLVVGWDHLLFLLALVLMCHTLGVLARAVTGFTVGHALAIATLAAGLVPAGGTLAAAAEVLIALSLMAAAIATTRLDPSDNARGGTRWAEFGLALAIGLVHGLGFAQALSAAAPAQSELVEAVLGFHLGVELAQLGFAVAVFFLWLAVPERWQPGGRWTVTYLVGVGGAYALLGVWLG